MKKRNLYRVLGIMAIMIILFTGNMQGQPPLPGGHGQNGNQGAGGAAPIDGGSLILIMSGLSYGAFKLIRTIRRKNDVL